MTDANPTAPAEQFFAGRGWKPFAFQLQTWRAYLAGESGLVHAPTGSGKTWSVFGGPAIEGLRAMRARSADAVMTGKSRKTRSPARRAGDADFTLLWLTPMRALANDTAHNLTQFVAELGLNWSVELRTSDTTATIRKRQREKLPSLLVTTPESLSMLLSYADAMPRLTGVQCVVVDEWHELLSTKRGVQAELGIARLRRWNPHLRTWGLTATLGNLQQAAEVLVPAPARPVVIHAEISKQLEVRSLIPATIERFPWGGHMGLQMLGQVCAAIGEARSTLVFTNTRAQAEIWFRSIMEERPDWLGKIAIHHGSIDRKLRLRVEAMLRDGALRAVVCTSSLDLGVDFPEVDQVVQIGSPKGVGRLMQRAGRSGHRPGQPSVVIGVPTHALELMEFSAAREGIARREIESRIPLNKPLDLLVQHIVTLGAGGGFSADELFAEVGCSHAYASLSREEFEWALDFASRGGKTLTAYQRFAKLTRNLEGVWNIVDDKLARLHRLGIGTITGDGVVQLAMNTGRKLGTIEESFISRLKPGDTFTFAGRPLELLGMRDMTARVRPARKKGSIPQWGGGRFPLSTQLADKVRRRLHDAGRGVYPDAELSALRPIIDTQAAVSRVPAADELLIETSHSREGTHHFLFCFSGRLVHEGLGAVIGYRLKQALGVPVVATLNDYGIELLTPGQPPPIDEAAWRSLLGIDRLTDDLLACMNAGELARRQFREISRVAGLLVPTSPGAPRSVRQLQASSELFFDVFNEFDPDNLLLEQARREVLDHQLEFARLSEALRRLASEKILLVQTRRFSPLAFPIWAQRIQSQTIRMEAADDRIERMLDTLERQSQNDGN